MKRTKRDILAATIVVLLICAVPESFASNAATHVSPQGATLDLQLRSRFLENESPCSQYREIASLPRNHPCAADMFFKEEALIPRLVGILKKNNPNAGKHPGGPKNHPGGPKKHPGGPKRHPGGPKKHPGGPKRHPSRGGNVSDPRCRLNPKVCLDPTKNGYLAGDPTATTCCRTKCVSTVTSSKNCGGCSQRCGSKTCCRGVCIDTRSDANNCGNCGTVCDPAEFCVDGECTSGY